MEPHLQPVIPAASLEEQAISASPIPVDRINELYRGEIFTSETARVARERIHWMCAQCTGDSVLDVGCSQGITSILLAREGLAVTAIDTHPDSVQFARNEFTNEMPLVQSRLKLVETDLASLPGDALFDTIVLGEVLEHQAMPERFLQAAASHLKSNGRLVITTPFALHPHEDHKISVMPRHVAEIAESIGLSVRHLDVADGYIRAVLDKASIETQRAEKLPDLLAITEAATLASQRRLFDRLGERAEQLKKRADVLKVAQKKLAEATVAAETLQKELKSLHEGLAASEAGRKKAEKSLADQTTAQQRAIADKEAGHRKAIATLQNDIAVSKKRALELEEIRIALSASELKHKREIARLEERADRMMNRLAALKESNDAVKATTSYRLGRLMVRGFKSPRAFLGLPAGLLSLARDVSARRKLRALLGNDAGPDNLQGSSARHLAGASAGQLPQGLGRDELAARLDHGGVAALKSHILGLKQSVDGKQLAKACLDLGKSVSKTAGRDVDFALAELALELDGSEPTLRGYFWAAQRTLRIEETYRTFRDLETLYGKLPRGKSAEMLEKLQRSSAIQLRVFELVAERPTAVVESVPRRVCYVLHNSLPYSSGGYATRAQGVATGLMATGYEMVVLTRPGFPLDTKPELTAADVAAEEVIDGVRFIRTLEPQRTPGMPVLPYMQAAATVMEQRLRDLRPQVVIAASNYRTALPALIASRRLGIPFVYEVRGFWEVTRISREPEYEDTPAYATQALMEAKVAQLADHVFTLTGPMREELVSRGVPAEKIGLLPNSCDPQRFVPRERDRQLAARWSIPDGVPVIGYIGTFVDYEGLEDLALACALLKKRGIEFRLLLVGNENASGQDRGPITEQIHSVARSEGFSEWLIMPGRVPHEEVESYYSLIDIAPFPRKPLPVCEMVSPMKPLEALAMEKAVVVSSVQALVEMIDDGNTGRVFEKGSVAALADVLDELIKHPEQRQALGKQGRRWVSTERTWNQVGQKFHQIVQDKLSRPGVEGHSPVGPKAVPSRNTTAPPAVRQTPTAVSGRATPSRAQDPKPQWWTQIDKAFRERCGYVDVTRWALSQAAADLRKIYLERFDAEVVNRRIPSNNWARADICAQTVVPHSSLLDVGSGLGEFVNLIAREGRHGDLTSVDLRDWDLWFDATGKLQRVYSNILELDSSCSRDVVTCFEVIEHLAPEMVSKAVSRLRLVAREKLYVSVPFMEPLPLYRGHRTRFDAANLTELFPDGRFTVYGKGNGEEIRAWIMCEVDIAATTAATDVPHP